MRDGVVEHLPVDDVGQPAFQTPHCFHIGFAAGHLAVEVGASLGGVAQLHGRHDVQHLVDLAVTGSRQPMPDLVT
jgi:hypothetical protein